ncbi:MAG: HAD hydrolase-like protein [Bifidobacteriaceae bacterium]|jgi:phosphoglycolate phosphatase-like HAD superfamily hydrolase|nr:HAD hydrolase-like protein [Bifidobacteriaceae bacterium]
MLGHVVWDWNGTLLDDTDLIVACARAVSERFGVRELDRQRWRRIARRPMRATYEVLAGRALTDTEWQGVQHDWFALYRAGFAQAALAPDALGALRAVQRRGLTQSVVSMTPEDQLAPQVESRGVAIFLSGLAGTNPSARAGSGNSKCAILRAHLDGLGLRPSQTVVIGDNPDDAVTARAVGTAAILVPTGDAARSRLAATGFPVAANLSAAIAMLDADAANLMALAAGAGSAGTDGFRDPPLGS